MGLNSERVKKALEICFDAHKNQSDLSGKPYIFHPIHLAEQMETENEICTALLHDVVEDSDYTLEDFLDMGFPAEVIEAVQLLTHDPKVSYPDYIAALKDNPLARKVKLADLRHNSDTKRFSPVTERDFQRLKKYQDALKVLENQLR